MKTTTLFGMTATSLLLLAHPTLARQDSPAKMGMNGKMPEHCMMMQQMQQKMMSANKAQDARLKTLMATMDRSKGGRKVSAMSAVINELVAQRSSRQAMMSQMQPQMMGHMMEHMQSGDKSSMNQCPMMGKGMMGGGMGMMGKGGMMGHDMSKMKSK